MRNRSSRQGPEDINEIALRVASEATGEEVRGQKEEKNPAAVELGRMGGLRGGKARALKLSAERRTDIARRAAMARWHSGEDA
jgi:hypothetical protein